MSADPHLPVIHLRTPHNWMNDPNGLVFFDDHFHVFFQYNPHSSRHANMHWGHFRSRDLLTWELLPTAIAPTPGGDDADGVWSGNAIDHAGQLIAFYSAMREDRWWQPVLAASSPDGVNFTKAPQPLIGAPPDGVTMFRDPYVWRDRAGWRMLVGASLAEGRGAALQYVSNDLQDWTYLGPFHASRPTPLPGGGDTEEGWECVQYADLGDDHGALLISAWDPDDGAGRTAVFTGRDRGATLEPAFLQRLDYGPDFYAPALMQAPDGRWLMWGWIWEARDEARVGAPSEWTDTVGWAGMLSLPRELTRNGSGVHQRPAREITALRGRCLIDTSGRVEGSMAHPLGEVTRSLDVIVRLAAARDGRTAAGLRLITSADGNEHLDVTLDPTTGEVVVDRSGASLDLRAKPGAWRIPTSIEPGDAVELRLLFDHSVVEIFTTDGTVATVRFYPVADGPWRLEARGLGESEVEYAVTAWQMQPIEYRG